MLPTRARARQAAALRPRPGRVVIDHYQVLGLRRDASQLAIKRAYRRLAKKHHPDRNPGDPLAGERFKTMSAAYEVLGDPEERRLYDLQLFGLDAGAPAAAPAPPPTGAYRDVVWEALRDYGRRQASRGAPLAATGAFDWVDGALGCLLSVSFAMAAAVRSEAPRIMVLTLVALISGWLLAELPALDFGARLSRETALLLTTGLGVVASGLMAPAGPSALVESSGWLPAAAGGMAGGLLGASLGRLFRWSAGPVVGAPSAMLIGAAVGGGVGGFLWYWTTVFRWVRPTPPPDESLSLVALTGVIGAALGGALGALVGATRVRSRPD